MTPSTDPPQSTYIAVWRDTSSSDFIILGAYATLADANSEVRKRGRDQLVDGLTHDDIEAQTGGIDAEPLRWDTAEGLSCWVEEHVIQKHVDKQLR